MGSAEADYIDISLLMFNFMASIFFSACSLIQVSRDICFDSLKRLYDNTMVLVVHIQTSSRILKHARSRLNF